MSVVTLNISVSYLSSGSVGPYGFNFPISDPSALKVIVNNSVVSPTLYTILPLNNNYDNGGSITFVSAPTAGQTVVLQRSTPLTQTSQFHDNMPNPMAQFEAGLDKLTEIVQEIAANQTGSGSGATIVTAGAGINVTGSGTVANPYVVSVSTAFGILTFTGGQAGEIGQSFTNPSFAATYSGTPTSANVTNTDGIDSPLNLTAPYTSAAVIGTFHHTAAATVTFTLTATNGVSSPTATQTLTWQERIFGGVGTIGATSSVTATGTTAVLSTGDALPSAGLGIETIGQNFGPFSPSGQAVYLLLSGGSHTFTDALTGFPFAFNTPTSVTFVNQFGVSLSMFLYQSTNSLTGTFQPKVAS